MNEQFTLAGKQIDGVLKRVGSVEPRTGFEQRLLASIASESRALALKGTTRASFLGRFSVSVKAGGLLLASGIAAAAVLVGAAIHEGPGSIPVAPTAPVSTHQRPAPGGFGTAAAAHTPDQPVSVGSATSRGRGTHRPRQGRTVLHSSPLHRADGTATPDSPYPH